MRALLGLAGPFAAVLLLPSPSGQWSLLADPRPEVVVGAVTVLVAMAVSWLLAAWGALMCAAAAGSRLPGAGGAVARRLLTAITPIVLRRVVMTAAGISVAAGLAACGSPGTVTDSQPTAPTAAIVTTAAGADSLGIDLDWPVAVPAAPATGTLAAERPAAASSASAHRRAPDMTPPAATPQPPADSGAGARPEAPIPTATPPAFPGVAAGPTTMPGRPDAPPVLAATAGVIVRPGDSLWSIAAAHLPDDATPARIDAAWRAWYRANRDVIGPNPNLVIPGQVLHAPDEGAADAAAPETAQ